MTKPNETGPSEHTSEVLRMFWEFGVSCYLLFIFMYMCMCLCVCVCARMHVRVCATFV